MKKTNVTETEFGRIVEEIPTCEFDCAMTHIYINNLTKEAEDYLLNLVRTVPTDKIRSYMVHYTVSASSYNDEYTEVMNILQYFGEE